MIKAIGKYGSCSHDYLASELASKLKPAQEMLYP